MDVKMSESSEGFKILLSLFVSCFSLENREPWTSFFSWMEIWKASPRGCGLWVCWAGPWAESGAWFPKCQWWIEPSFVFLAPPAVSFHRLYRSAPLLWFSHLCVNRFKWKAYRNSVKEKKKAVKRWFGCSGLEEKQQLWPTCSFKLCAMS